MSMKKGQIKPEDMLIQIITQAMHDRLADVLQQHDLNKSGSKSEEHSPAVNECQVCQTSQTNRRVLISNSNIPIYTQLHQARQSKGCTSDKERQKNTGKNTQLMGSAIAENPLPYTNIRDLTDTALFKITKIMHYRPLPCCFSAIA